MPIDMTGDTGLAEWTGLGRAGNSIRGDGCRDWMLAGHWTADAADPGSVDCVSDWLGDGTPIPGAE